MPDESQAITVKELNAKLATMNSGDALGELIAVKGYIAANNEGGALHQLLSLVDNTGEANTGIIIKGNDYTEKDLPVGTKVIVSLKYATYDLYNGLPQIKMATVFATQEKATIKVPEITDAQCGDYLGQYVKVKNLTPATSATTWVVARQDHDDQLYRRNRQNHCGTNYQVCGLCRRTDRPKDGRPEGCDAGIQRDASDLPHQHGGRCRLQSRVTRHNPSVCKKIPAGSNPRGFSVSKRGRGRGRAEDLRAVYSMELKNNR